MHPLKAIEFTKLKGATNDSPVLLEFDDKRPIVMIYGENGTGKSTIIDAFDFVCNENIGSFDGISIGSGKKIRYCPSINANSSDVAVTLRSSDQQAWTGVLGPNSIPTISGPENRPVAKILRRHSLLGFIAAEPKERYRQLSSFIASPQIDRAEKSLGELIKNTSRAFEIASQEYGTAKDNLENLWEREGKANTSASEWAKGIRDQDTAQLEKGVKGLKALVGQIEAIERSNQDLLRLHKDYSEKQIAYQASETEYNDQLQSAIEHIEELSAVLTSAEAYFASVSSSKTCPVCQNTIDAAEVARDVGERNEALGTFRAAKDKKARASRQLKQAKGALEAGITNSVEKVQALRDSIAQCDIAEVPKFHIAVPEKLKAEIANVVEYVKQLSGLSTLKEELTALLDAKSKVVNTKNSVITYLESIERKQEEAEESSQLKSVAEEIRAILEQERKDFVDELLRDISSEVDAMYQKMHPSEHIGNVLWKIDPSKRNSIDVSGSFVGTPGVPPQAYYSEAHLDTLGIAIFLGLAKKFGSENTIVILDDILTSVDQGHVTRFLDILYDMQEHFLKIVITTHYRPWRDRYKYARGPAGNIQFVELLPWTLEKGIRHTKTKLNLEELEGLIANEPFDRQAAASKGGIFLESLFDFLTIQYQSPLPRRADNEYTLGDFQGAFSTKFLKALTVTDAKNGNQVTELRPLIEDIFSQTWLRNQVGCHFNINGLNLADTDVSRFLNGVIAMGKALICDGCGELPRRKKEGSFWQCSCGALQMLPLERP